MGLTNIITFIFADDTAILNPNDVPIKATGPLKHLNIEETQTSSVEN